MARRSMALMIAAQNSNSIGLFVSGRSSFISQKRRAWCSRHTVIHARPHDNGFSTNPLLKSITSSFTPRIRCLNDNKDMTDRETYNTERQRCKCAYRIPLQHNLCFVKLLYMRPRGQRDKTLNQPDDSHYQSGRFHKKRESKSNDPWTLLIHLARSTDSIH